MPRLVFGVDVEPGGKPVPMAYVARHPTCGHIVQIVPEKDRSDLDLMPGRTYSREPLKGLSIKRCKHCRPPKQRSMW